jgi:tagatose-1,6-bisphosphate aldolase non-catalytic subunit AgaZ/GatZ
MDAIEFNKTLWSSFDKLKAGAPEKMLTECRNMGFEKHTTVKLLHCSLNSINEDEYTILQRSFENVG